LPGIERGIFQSEIRQKRIPIKAGIDKGERIIVGVNKFADAVEAKQDLLRIDNSIEVKQTKSLKELRSTRDNKKVEAFFKDESASEKEEN